MIAIKKGKGVMDINISSRKTKYNTQNINLTQSEIKFHTKSFEFSLKTKKTLSNGRNISQILEVSLLIPTIN